MAYNAYPGSRYNDLYAKYPEPKPFNPVDEIGPALDTVNARPPIQAAGHTSITRPPVTPGPAVPATPGAGSPELAGLVHSIQAPMTTTTPQAPAPAAPAPVAAPVATPVATAPVVAAPQPAAPAIPAYLQPLIDAIPGLMNPVTAPMTMDPAARQAMLDQATRTSQGATNIAAEQLREKMGGATGGLVAPGESGLADTALASIYRGGASDVAGIAGKLASEEAARAPEYAQNLAQLNLSRLLAGGQLGQGLADVDLSQQGLTYQQQQDALQMLMQMYGGEQGYQQAAWSPYYSGIAGAYGG